ncbi:MAG: MoaD/ThiS family protein [Chloroflexota bacterium]
MFSILIDAILDAKQRGLSFFVYSTAAEKNRSGASLTNIQIHLNLYGPLAAVLGGKYIAQKAISLAEGAVVRDLMSLIGIPHDQKSYLFINAVLCDMPGLSASLDEALHDGDHVGIFSRQHMWPYQYRDGIRMSESLTEALRKRGAMHNTY